MRPLLGLLAVLLIAPAAASAAPTSVPLQGGTAVREYAGTALISVRDPAKDAYRLATVHDGAVTPIRGVPPQGAAFDADIGPGADGRAQIIFSRTNDGQRDLFVVSLPNGAVRPVSNANTRLDEVSPTVDRGRIAFARVYGSGDATRRNPVVYTKLLVAPRARPSTRLPGVPQRRCGDVDRTCGPTTERFVLELELGATRLAESVFYSCGDCSGIAQNEVRQVDLRDGRAEQIAFQMSGLSGQTLSGLSYDGADLAFYKSCGGDTSACQGGNGGPRLSRADGAFFTATGPSLIGGFAFTGSDALEVVGCGDGGQGGASCRLETTDPIAFRRATRPLRGTP